MKDVNSDESKFSLEFGITTKYSGGNQDEKTGAH